MSHVTDYSNATEYQSFDHSQYIIYHFMIRNQPQNLADILLNILRVPVKVAILL